jgi:branched-chain amino acid transport system substrate-binding protein
MDLRKIILGCVVSALLLAGIAGCGGSSSSSESESSGGESASGGSTESSGGGEPILIGVSAAKTGLYESYDLPAGRLMEMRFEQANEEGGVLGGREIKTKWIDTKSEKSLAGTYAKQLISEGAKMIVATCDFDYSFPAIAAANAESIPAMALCASSPKSANPALVGEMSGTMGPGSDAEGVAMAEWLHKEKPELKSAYILEDTAIQYSQATAEYFKAKWEELGGKICGEDSFVGSPTLDLSSQITRLRGAQSGCDLVYDSSFTPYSQQVLRAVRDGGIELPIAANAALSGTVVKEIAGPVSEVYALGFACVDTYCKGGSKKVAELNAMYTEKYGEPIPDAYAMPGWALGNVIVDALEKAGSDEATALAEALFKPGLSFEEASGNTQEFTEACHRPQPAYYSVEQVTKGEIKQVGEVTVKELPDIGDNNPCL